MLWTHDTMLNSIKGSHYDTLRFHRPVRVRPSYDKSSSVKLQHGCSGQKQGTYSAAPSKTGLASIHKMTSSDPSTPRISSRQLAPDTDRVHKRSVSSRRDEAKTGRIPKTWSSEDERILLQSRLERIPYKQIGARLGKTDLACRLHFHQMVTARKSPDAQPGRSIVFLSSEHPPEIHRLAPFVSKPNMAEPFHSRSSSMNSMSGDTNVVLPRIVDHPHRRSYSYPNAYSNQFPEWHPTSSAFDPTLLERAPDNPGQNPNVNRGHMNDFWPNSSSAEQGDLSYPYYAGTPVNPMFAPPNINQSAHRQPLQPGAVREAWPNQSPQQYVDNSNNVQSPGRCSVESMLNHRG